MFDVELANPLAQDTSVLVHKGLGLVTDTTLSRTRNGVQHDADAFCQGFWIANHQTLTELLSSWTSGELTARHASIMPRRVPNGLDNSAGLRL